MIYLPYIVTNRVFSLRNSSIFHFYTKYQTVIYFIQEKNTKPLFQVKGEA